MSRSTAASEAKNCVKSAISSSVFSASRAPVAATFPKYPHIPVCFWRPSWCAQMAQSACTRRKAAHRVTSICSRRSWVNRVIRQCSSKHRHADTHRCSSWLHRSSARRKTPTYTHRAGITNSWNLQNTRRFVAFWIQLQIHFHCAFPQGVMRSYLNNQNERFTSLNVPQRGENRRYNTLWVQKRVQSG